MSELLNCYNKGCGQSFDPATNKKGIFIYSYLVVISYFANKNQEK